MTRLPETITTKFTELFGAIHFATDDLKIAGAEANLNGDFSQVAVINDQCQKLQALEADVKSVLNSFESRKNTRKTIKANPKQSKVNSTRNSSGYFQVTLAGQVIKENTASNTFVETLKRLGFERVDKLNKIVSGLPLLAKTSKTKEGYQTQDHVGDWYITTHLNNQHKKKLLEEIGRDLHTPIKVEIIDCHLTQ